MSNRLVCWNCGGVDYNCTRCRGTGFDDYDETWHSWLIFGWRKDVPMPDGLGYFKWSIKLGPVEIAWAYRRRGYLIVRIGSKRIAFIGSRQ